MKTKTTILLVLLLVTMIVTPVFAQGSKESDVKQISICTPYLSSVTTKQMADLMKGKLETKGYNVSIYDSANDNSKFASDVETSVISGVDAIIIVSADPNLIESQIKEAADANIPVFGCDAGYIDEMQMNATSDNYQMGEMIATYLFEQMGKQGTFVHLTHRPHPGVVKRSLAMEDLLPKYPNITLVSEHHVDVPNQINNSKEIVENVLTTYPQKGSIDAILCAWDEPAIGATQALMEAGRDEVLVVGVDGNEQAIKLINDSTNLIATLSQNFENMAEIVANEVEKVLKGEQASKGDVFAPALLITK
jgi:ribose transport system substrate-binding protein